MIAPLIGLNILPQSYYYFILFVLFHKLSSQQIYLNIWCYSSHSWKEFVREWILQEIPRKLVAIGSIHMRYRIHWAEILFEGFMKNDFRLVVYTFFGSCSAVLCMCVRYEVNIGRQYRSPYRGNELPCFRIRDATIQSTVSFLSCFSFFFLITFLLRKLSHNVLFACARYAHSIKIERKKNRKKKKHNERCVALFGRNYRCDFHFFFLRYRTFWRQAIRSSAWRNIKEIKTFRFTFIRH